MSWLSLAVDEGQPAFVEGVLVRIRESFAVLTDQGTVVVGSDGVAIASSMAVCLLIPEDLDLRSLENTTVVATGRLVGERLAVSGASSFASRTPTRGRPTHVLQASATQGDQRPVPRVLRPEGERALMQEGVMLDLWESQVSPGKFMALATDVDRVRQELVPRYGPSVDVIASRWTEAFLNEVESLVMGSPTVLSFGRDIGPDLQMRVAATLLCLPSPLARTLDTYPPEVVALDLLIRPA